MIKNIKNKILKNFQIFSLILLIILSAISTSYFNYKKNINRETYIDFINNIYFKKTLNHIIQNLDPKYKKIKHKVKSRVKK